MRLAVVLRSPESHQVFHSSTVGIATGCGLNDRGVWVWVPVWGPPSGYGRWSGRDELDHSPPTSADQENVKLYCHSPISYVFMAECLIKFRDNFTFYLYVNSLPSGAVCKFSVFLTRILLIICHCMVLWDIHIKLFSGHGLLICHKLPGNHIKFQYEAWFINIAFVATFKYSSS